MEPVIIGVPGPWESRDALVRALGLAQLPPRFLLAGPVMMELRSRHAIQVHLQGPDPRMGQIMAATSNGGIDGEEAARIDGHKSTLYLLEEDHDIVGARRLLQAADALLAAGGLAVKVESAGASHPADRWSSYARRGDRLAAMAAMVTLVGGEDYCYSAGMHILGLPDCSVSTRVSMDEIPSLITAFNHWQLLEAPALADGDLFATELDGSNYELRLLPFGYEEDSPLNNPFGRWHLEPSERSLVKDHPFGGDGPLFMALDPEDPEVQQARRRAQASLGRLAGFLADPHDYGLAMFKTRITHGDESARMWLALEEADEEALTGRLFELPPELGDLDQSRLVRVPLDAVDDWSIRRCGAVEGGFSLQVQRARVPAAERRAFDLFTGNLGYLPAEEIVGRE